MSTSTPSYPYHAVGSCSTSSRCAATCCGSSPCSKAASSTPASAGPMVTISFCSSACCRPTFGPSGNDFRATTWPLTSSSAFKSHFTRPTRTHNGTVISSPAGTRQRSLSPAAAGLDATAALERAELEGIETRLGTPSPSGTMTLNRPSTVSLPPRSVTCTGVHRPTLYRPANPTRTPMISGVRDSAAAASRAGGATRKAAGGPRMARQVPSPSGRALR